MDYVVAGLVALAISWVAAGLVYALGLRKTLDDMDKDERYTDEEKRAFYEALWKSRNGE